VLFDKSIFSAEDVRRMHQKDDAEEKDFIGKKCTAPATTE